MNRTPAGARNLRPRILILAGEPSGDEHGSRVAVEIRARWPDAELLGTGGSAMAAAGVRLLRELDDMAVMGFVEVVGRLGFFRALEKELSQLLVGGGIDLVLPVDYPGLNLRIARRAKAVGVPVVYYISPQVWAWKAHRARLLSGVADRIAVILPFEVPIYEEAGGRVEFVGHPLLDRGPELEPADFHGSLGLEPDRPILALFPGSRAQELARHLAPFLAVAGEVLARRPEIQVVVSKTPSLSGAAFGDVPFPVTEDGAGLRAAATAGLVKSGTSTLEASLAGMPFVMAYKTHPLTYLLAMWLIRVPHIALSNLVAGERVVPEFIQGDVKPVPVADALLPLLDDRSPARARMLDGFSGIREQLGGPGAAGRVAELVGDVLAERGRVRGTA